MAFDDILQPRRNSTDEKAKTKSPTTAPKSSASSSLFSQFDVQEWARGMGLSDELTHQVIVPLVAILDRHGGKFVDTQSKELKTAGSLVGTITEFAPLLQGAYHYFSGVRKELNDADEALLEAHTAAISATELSSLFGSEDELVIETEEPSPQPKQNKAPSTFGPDGFNPPSASQQIIASGKVDYYELLGHGSEKSFGDKLAGTVSASEVYTSQQDNLENQTIARSNGETPTKVADIVPVDTLTLENGMSTYEVERSDTTTKINQGLSMDSVPITQKRVQDDMSEIEKLMKIENLKRKTTSQFASIMPEMSAEEIIADMKTKARPGAGGQQTGEVRKMGGRINVSDEELLGFVTDAFSIPGLADAQSQEAAQLKASSKLGEAEKKVNPINELSLPATTTELKPITWQEAIEDNTLNSTSENKNKE